MKAIDRNQRLILIVAIALVATGAYFYWPKTPSTTGMRFTPDESRCMERVVKSHGDAVKQNSAAMIRRLQLLTQQRMTLKNTAADLDAMSAANDYANKMGDVATFTGLCRESAACVPRMPFKALFDACYETWTAPPEEITSQPEPTEDYPSPRP
jgi:hypothetical protein